MSEYQPENTASDPQRGATGADPYKGMPDRQGEPFDPRQSYAQQPATPGASNPVQQAAPPVQPYGQPYGQAAPPGQPYGQPYGQAAPPVQPDFQQAPMATVPQTSEWGAPPSSWNSTSAKKRKVWPWVVGGISAVVLLGVAGVSVVLGVNGALNADQNRDYTAAPIAAGDVPKLGDKILVSDDGALAFEMGSGWVDANNFTDVSTAMGDLPEGGSIMAAYFTFDPIDAVDKPPSFVVVIEGAPSDQVGPINITSMHADFMVGALDSLEGTAQAIEGTGPDALTTANGLDGLVSTITCEVQGIPVRSYVYTFARGERVAFVQIVSYTDKYDDATATLVTDSFRIDK